MTPRMLGSASGSVQCAATSAAPTGTAARGSNGLARSAWLSTRASGSRWSSNSARVIEVAVTG